MPSADMEHNIRILHVDDDPDILKFTKLILEKNNSNFKVDCIKSPEEALVYYKEGFDCIISDYRMPYINGIEFASIIRKESKIPFILYTGQGSEEVASAAFTIGIDDYIKKEANPSHFKVLAKRIQTVVDKHVAEEKLLESEAKYQALVEESLQGLAIVKVEPTKILFANKKLAEMLGYSLDELLDFTSRRLFNIVYHEDRKRLKINLMRIMRGEKIKDSNEHRLVRKNGDIFWVRMLGGRINYLGNPSVQTSISDISDRKKMEKKMQENQQLVTKIMESAPYSFYLFDSELKLVDFNEVVNHQPIVEENALGRHLWDISPSSRTEGRIDKYREVMATGKSCDVISTIELPNVGKKQLFLRAFKMGEGLGLITTDISNMKYMTEELNQSQINALNYEGIFFRNINSIIKNK